jgi:hypothetical protein
MGKMKVEITSSEFHKPKALTSKNEFIALSLMSVEELTAQGCMSWDGRLMLFPKEWYDFIPCGFPIESILGKTETFIPGVTDDDCRFGYLSFGVVAHDGVKK